MPQDTTFDSAADFTEQTPSPQNNLVVPSFVLCPESRILTTPANPNNGTAATFTFDSPGNASGTPGLSFQCKLDNETSFSSCASPKTYNNPPLDTGSHTFSAKAVLNGVEDPTPAT